MLKRFRVLTYLILLLLTPIALTAIYYTVNLSSSAYMPVNTPPRAGIALSLDGTPSYIKIPKSINLRLDNRDIFKLSAWIMPTSDYKNTLISHIGPITSYEIYLIGGKVSFQIKDINYARQTLTSSVALPLNSWSLLRIETTKSVRDTQFVKIYNGSKEIGSGTIKITTPRQYFDTSEQYFSYIGTGITGVNPTIDSPSDDYFNGKIFEMKISGNFTVKGQFKVASTGKNYWETTCSLKDFANRNTLETKGFIKYYDVFTKNPVDANCKTIKP